MAHYIITFYSFMPLCLQLQTQSTEPVRTAILKQDNLPKQVQFSPSDAVLIYTYLLNTPIPAVYWFKGCMQSINFKKTPKNYSILVDILLVWHFRFANTGFYHWKAKKSKQRNVEISWNSACLIPSKHLTCWNIT